MTKRTFQISRTGEMDIRLGKVRYIGIENIADLKTYNMSRMGNRVMHIMEFNNGGSCEVTYLAAGSNAGKLEVFRTTRARVTLEESDAIVGQSRRSFKPQN
jgi:hypothetical protein